VAASDYVPIFFKNRLHLAGRPQMSTSDWTPSIVPNEHDQTVVMRDADLHTDQARRQAYSIDFVELFHQVARSIDKILKAAKPGDIPYYRPTKFELQSEAARTSD
jgi:hypothetical protein